MCVMFNPLFSILAASSNISRILEKGILDKRSEIERFILIAPFGYSSKFKNNKNIMVRPICCFSSYNLFICCKFFLYIYFFISHLTSYKDNIFLLAKIV